MVEAVKSLFCAKSLWDRVSSGVPALCADVGSCKAPQGWQEVQRSVLLSFIHLAEGRTSPTTHRPAPHRSARLGGCNVLTDNSSLHRELCRLRRASEGQARRDQALKRQAPRSPASPCAVALEMVLRGQVCGFACSPGSGLAVLHDS